MDEDCSTRAQEMKEMGSLLDFALLYLFGC